MCVYIYIYTYTHTLISLSLYIYIYIHTHIDLYIHIYIYIYMDGLGGFQPTPQQSKVKLATIVEGVPKAPFSIATTSRCRGGCYSFPWIAPFYLDPYLIMLSVKQWSTKYHFLNLCYDSTWEWTLVSQAIGKHSTHQAKPSIKWFFTDQVHIYIYILSSTDRLFCCITTQSWTRLIAFHIALIPLGKVWIQLFSLQLWVNSRTDWVLQPWWGN